jgi:hypothetical protein
MYNDSTTLGKTEGRRKSGRQRLRCLAFIDDDLMSVGVKRWRKKAPDI